MEKKDIIPIIGKSQRGRLFDRNEERTFGVFMRT